MSPRVSLVSSLMSRHCPVGTGAGSSSLEAEQRGPEDRAAKSSKQTQRPGMAAVGMGPAPGASTGTHTGSIGNLQQAGLGWPQSLVEGGKHVKRGSGSFLLVRKLGVCSGIWVAVKTAWKSSVPSLRRWLKQSCSLFFWTWNESWLSDLFPLC